MNNIISAIIVNSLKGPSEKWTVTFAEWTSLTPQTFISTKITSCSCSLAYMAKELVQYNQVGSLLCELSKVCYSCYGSASLLDKAIIYSGSLQYIKNCLV